jgi:hypothetical protein
VNRKTLGKTAIDRNVKEDKEPLEVLIGFEWKIPPLKYNWASAHVCLSLTISFFLSCPTSVDHFHNP